MEGNKSHRLQIGLDAATLKRARIAAAHAGVTLNDAVRQALTEYVERSEATQGNAAK